MTGRWMGNAVLPNQPLRFPKAYTHGIGHIPPVVGVIE
jgi:hypothetical protein